MENSKAVIFTHTIHIFMMDQSLLNNFPIYTVDAVKQICVYYPNRIQLSNKMVPLMPENWLNYQIFCKINVLFVIIVCFLMYLLVDTIRVMLNILFIAYYK